MAIPHLCYRDGLSAEGNCRACVVEVAGERTLAPSCCRAVTPGMEVQTHSERALKSQNMVLELLLSDLPDACHPEPDSESTTERPYGELSDWLARSQVRVRPALRAMTRAQPKADLSHPAMAVNLDACIQCTRCVRACRELQVNDVIGYARRGAHSQIVFDLDDAMGTSSCVACGECVQACPTGALSAKIPATAVIASEARQSMSAECMDRHGLWPRDDEGRLPRDDESGRPRDDEPARDGGSPRFARDDELGRPQPRLLWPFDANFWRILQLA